MVKTVRLAKFKNTYYIRVSIPHDLKRLVKNREIKYTLHTNDFYEALRRLKKESVKVDLAIEELRQNGEAILEKNGKNQLTLNEDEVDVILAHRYEEIERFFIKNDVKLKRKRIDVRDVSILKEYLSQTNYQKEIEDLYEINDEKQKVEPDFTERNRSSKERVKQYVFDFLRSERDLVKPYTKQFLDNLDLDDISIRSEWFYTKLYRRILALEDWALLKSQAIQNQEKHPDSSSLGNFLSKNRDALKKTIEGPTPKTDWKDFYNTKYIKKLQNNSVDERTQKNFLQKLELIFDFLGKKYIQEISYEDWRNLNNNFGNIPCNYRKKRMFHGLNLHKAIEKNEKFKETKKFCKTLSKKTQMTYFSCFKNFMNFALKERLITEDNSDAFDTYRKKGGRFDDSVVKAPFTDDEIKIIFDKATYPKAVREKDIAKYWIPLLGIYTGARISELSLLTVNDITQVDGVDCISINDNFINDNLKKSCKTANAIRYIPIHDTLISLGFLKFVQFTRRQNIRLIRLKMLSKDKKMLLFPFLTYNKTNKGSDSISKFFSRYCKKLNIKDKTNSFHSLRHTMRQKMFNQNINETHQCMLCGWSLSYSVPYTYYLDRNKVSIKMLKEDINKVQYPIDIQALKIIWK